MRHLGLLAFVALALALPQSAAAAPACPDSGATRTIVSGLGVLESVIFDNDGRLLYTDTSIDSLMSIDRPGAAPRVIAGGIDQPGGLVVEPDGDVLVGQGNGFINGAGGIIIGLANLIEVDPDTGVKATRATGLSMANGLARGPNGEIYASDDAGTAIDKVVGSTVQRNWSMALSTNGLAIDPTRTYLYAAQTFQPAAVLRIPLANPGNVQTYAAAGPADIAAGLDGMTIDTDGRLFVAANGGGQLWRIGTDRSICSVAGGLLLPSAVALGRGGAGFSPTSLYAVTFSGSIVEVTDARQLDSAATLYSLKLRPKKVRAGVKRRFRLRARRIFDGRRTPLAGAKIRFGGKTKTTNAAGVVRIRRRFSKAGLRRARLTLPGEQLVRRVRIFAPR